MVIPTSWGDRDSKRTADMGDDHPVLKVNDMSTASNQLAISAESVSFSAGAAGTTGVVALDKAPVMDATGALVGSSADTSLAWVTGTILTTEVAYLKQTSDTVQLAALSNGEYAIDYPTGKIRYCKATAGTTDTTNYTTRQTNIEVTATGSTSVTEATHDSAVVADGPQIQAEAKAFDDNPLPNTVSEGDAIRVAATLSGVQYFFPVTEDGAETPMTNEDEAMKNNQAGYTVHGQVAVFDGSALPTTGGTEGDASSFAVTSQGVQFVTLVNDDGSDYGQIKGYDSGTDSLKGFEVSPLSSHHVEETLADVTNETNATTSYYMDMDGYKTFAVQIEINSGATDTTTVTVEASIQDDGTAAASATYQDVTNEWFEAANFTEDTILERNVPVDVKFVKIKTVTAGGNNDADYALYSKKSY